MASVGGITLRRKSTMRKSTYDALPAAADGIAVIQLRRQHLKRRLLHQRASTLLLCLGIACAVAFARRYDLVQAMAHGEGGAVVLELLDELAGPALPPVEHVPPPLLPDECAPSDWTQWEPAGG